jgi:hypothetical protein
MFQDAETLQFPQSYSFVAELVTQAGWLCGSGAEGFTVVISRAPFPP